MKFRIFTSRCRLRCNGANGVRNSRKSIEEDFAVEDRGPEIIELRAALRAMADAYARKVKTGLTAEQIAKEPWRCAEYIEAERICKRPPFKLLGDPERMKQKILSDPDIECEAGPELFA
jgi:hypothetical protein